MSARRARGRLTAPPSVRSSSAKSVENVQQSVQSMSLGDSETPNHFFEPSGAMNNNVSQQNGSCVPDEDDYVNPRSAQTYEAAGSGSYSSGPRETEAASSFDRISAPSYNDASGYNSSRGSRDEEYRGRGFGDASRGGYSGSNRREPMTCFKCNEQGHAARDCPSSGASGFREDRKPNFRNDRGSNDYRGTNRNFDGPPKRQFGGGSSQVLRCQNCEGKGHDASACPSPMNDSPQKYSNSYNDNRRYDGGGGRGEYGNQGNAGFGREAGDRGRDHYNGGGGYRGDGGRESRYGDSQGNREQKSQEQPCRRCNEFGHLPYACPSRVGSKATDATEAKVYRNVVEITEEDARSRIGRGINFERYNKIQVKVLTSRGAPDEAAERTKIRSFQDAHLNDELMETIRKLGYDTPTPVQQYAIPIALSGRDVMACAQTGSGKTAAFVIPLMQTLLKHGAYRIVQEGPQSPLALILAPTRELAVQITKDAKLYGQRTSLHVKECYGGTHVGTQIRNISKGCHILVGTTGRVKDFVDRRVVCLDQLRFLVFDEADRMLDMGFLPDIDEIAKNFPRNGPKPQTLMFSATFKEDVQRMARKYLADDFIKLDVGVVGANEDVTQYVEELSGMNPKRTRLCDIIKRELSQNSRAKVLVFVETKQTADFLATYMSERDWKTTSIHGDRYQDQREAALQDFQRGDCSVLVATSVAARGLDITGVTHVVNFDMPKTIDEYIHRVGRTGRVGNKGQATTFYDSGRDSLLREDLKKTIMDSGGEIPHFLEF